MEALKEQLAVLDVQPSESMTQTLSAISEQLEQSSTEKSIIGGRGLLSAFHSGATLIPPDKPSSFGNIDGKWVEVSGCV
ncbi:unnamed protein product [Anisakis simplex]|uniref:PAP_fibrillin domain-containing protein n=1 Tax=Anisakis simplex TaxID=6269 RepID=A0A0M3JBQ3_ANISI|nr:unnamed protein product [Anisakis simplex]